MPPPFPSRRRGFSGFLRSVGRGLNVTRLVIINVVFFSVLLLVVLALTAGILGSRSERTVQSDSVLVLKPQGQLVEQYSIDPVQRVLTGLSGEEPRQVQLRDLVGAIDAAATDARITRILLLPGDLRGGGFAALREVGAALDPFRAPGKPVISWAVNHDKSQY
jgi:protease-4